ncbi:MAG TPA: STAS domain-containing protein [Drouetiella sp.]|jgi:rsbT co-antagonist protein RsbR
MTNDTINSVTSILRTAHKEVLNEWIEQLLKDPNRTQAVPESSLRTSTREFYDLFQEASKNGNLEVSSSDWDPVRNMLTELSAGRAMQGSTPSETANFIFSLKQPLFTRITKELGNSSTQVAATLLEFSKLIDTLGLYTFESFQKTREAVIRRQQKDMLEMSTPVIKLWEGVVAVPLIGTLDSARTQIVMESLLQAIVETSSRIAILDITGVPTVDTQTAQHLIKTVSATRLMGADCIISGIRPQIAQTIVHLGIDIYDIPTKATMSDAIKEAMERTGFKIIRDFASEKDR